LNEKRILSGEQIPSNYTLQLKEFMDAIRRGRTPIASGEEIINTMMVLEAARLSEKEKRVVFIEERKSRSYEL
jgi:predicted dehydrogenase